MIDTSKFTLLKIMTELVAGSDSDSSDFPKQICSFLVAELNLKSAAIVSVSTEHHFSILGFEGSIIPDFNDALLKTEILKSSNGISINIKTGGILGRDIQSFSSIDISSDNSAKILLILFHDFDFGSNDKNILLDISEFVKFISLNWNKKRNSGLNTESIVLKSLMELRTPVNTIIGFTSILTEDNISSSQAQYLNTIKENAQKIQLNINDLLDYIRIKEGKTALNKVNLSLDQFTKQISEVFKNRYQSKFSSLKVEIENTGNYKIDADDQKLRFAFNNILNYIILSVTNPDILIRINSPQFPDVKFIINGSSSDITKLYRIFEPFSLPDNKNSKDFNLSDTSLLLAREYIKINNGEVSAKAVGSSSFEILLSFGNDYKAVGKQLSSLPKPTAERNSILVIEDDYAASKLLSNYLTKWGYSPVIVNTAEQTLEQISRTVFLAVILDISLPNINGLELLRKINEHPNAKNTPVIVSSIETEQQKAFLMGAVEYFVKPINYNYLVEVLTSYKLRKESNILCVDDDVPTLNLIKQAVETAGFNAVAEHISSNVMPLIADKQIDLAIIDLDMPHPNGFELIKIIKSDSRFQNLPIIIYTGKENFSDDLKNIDGMFEELLSKKSTNLEDLSGIISSMINRYEEPTPAEKISEAKEGVKILFAEDYKHSQIIVTRLLKKNNFNNVVVVENGEEALKLAEKEKFDLILMDMQMPVMNGFEATEKIKNIPEYKNTPIIALTAFAMKGDREKCLEAGATDYIPKPIDSKEFLEKVKYYTSSV